MRRSLVPSFARSSTERAVDEFRAMMVDVGEDAAMFLAELCDMDEMHRVAIKDRSACPGLFTRYLSDWVAFYAWVGTPFQIVVLHVAKYRGETLERDEFSKAQKKALERLSTLELA